MSEAISAMFGAAMSPPVLRPLYHKGMLDAWIP